MGTDSHRGLYRPGFERDSCGFGLIANLDNRASLLPGITRHPRQYLPDT